jgi:hypothetical protein
MAHAGREHGSTSLARCDPRLVQARPGGFRSDLLFGFFADTGPKGLPSGLLGKPPHNQNLYIYHSENGQISAYQPEGQTAVLIFPDGQWTRLTQIGENNPATDQVALIWADSPTAPDTLTVAGHLPRSYPCSTSITYPARHACWYHPRTASPSLIRQAVKYSNTGATV